MYPLIFHKTPAETQLFSRETMEQSSVWWYLTTPQYQMRYYRNCIEVWYQVINKHLWTQFTHISILILTQLLVYSRLHHRGRGSWWRGAWSLEEEKRVEEEERRPEEEKSSKATKRSRGKNQDLLQGHTESKTEMESTPRRWHEGIDSPN